jgi:hypothetical protein
MSRKSKSKYQTKALNIPFTLTQGDLLQEALAVTFAKDQTQALNIPVKSTSLANVTAKASCSRSPCVRVNGMFNALVWYFDFDLRDMSNEV